MLPTTRRLNRLAIAALAAATCGFPAAAFVAVAHGDPTPRLVPARAVSATRPATVEFHNLSLCNSTLACPARRSAVGEVAPATARAIAAPALTRAG